MDRSVKQWLAERRRALHMHVAPLSWSDNREWWLDGGVLRHVSGGFFSVRGVAVHAPGTPYHGRHLPMIDQPEIGLLAFLVRLDDHGARWLLQAKSEPGSEGFTQV